MAKFWHWFQLQRAKRLARRNLPHSLVLWPPFKIRNELELQPLSLIADLLRSAILRVEVEPALHTENPPRVWFTIDPMLATMISAFGALAYRDKTDREFRSHHNVAAELALSLCNTSWTALAVHICTRRWSEFLRIPHESRVVVDIIQDDKGFNVALWADKTAVISIRRLASVFETEILPKTEKINETSGISPPGKSSGSS